MTEDVCKCAVYAEYGAYCERWGFVQYEWCFLTESPKSQYCPGATQGYDGVYYTKDRIVCNKSESKYGLLQS